MPRLWRWRICPAQPLLGFLPSSTQGSSFLATLGCTTKSPWDFSLWLVSVPLNPNVPFMTEQPPRWPGLPLVKSTRSPATKFIDLPVTNHLMRFYRAVPQ